MKSVFAALTALVLTAGAAGAATLDFSGANPCVSSDPFVTLSVLPTVTCAATTAPVTGSQGISLSRPGLVAGLSVVRADFAGLVDFVSIDLGDFGADRDNIFLEVFNAGGVSLGYVDFVLPSGISSASEVMHTLSLSVSGIAFATFGTNAGDLGFIVADNLTYTPSTVPLPAGGLLLLAGLGAFGALARRRKAV